jgi:Putative bacterial sensory transduction regulator
MERTTMKRFVLFTIAFALLLFVTADVFSQSKIARTVSNDTIEKILKSLELKYQKDERKDKVSNAMFFDFVRSEQACRLYNYRTDLWLECQVEKKMSMEDVNRWNADAKFSRLVLIEDKGKTILSLESQLDCEGGVTEAMITRYINRFDDEAKKFAKFVK